MVVVVELEVLVCDCGCSAIELLELELFGLEVAVPALGVWFCGVVTLWFCSGVAVLVVEFSGVVVVEVGFATLPAAWPLVLLEAGVCEALAEPATPPVVDCAPLSAAGLCDDTPEPSCDDGDALQVSAMCFTLVTVKFLPADADDCVWPVLLAEADEVVSLPVVVPDSCTWWPTCCFRSAVAPFS